MSQATDQYRAAVSRYEEAERERDALKAELAAIRALEPMAWIYAEGGGDGHRFISEQNPANHDPQSLADAEVIVTNLYALPEKKK